MDVDVDVSTAKRPRILKAMENYFSQMGSEVRQVATFKTEGTSQAIKTGCAGLGLPIEVGDYLSSLVPVERGFNWTFKECMEGKDGKKPAIEFIEEVNKYPGLKEVIESVEGLICGRSRHACFTEDVMVRTPKGEVKISDIKKGDMVFTHKNRYREVLDTQRNESDETVIINTPSSLKIETTPNHPFYVRTKFRTRTGRDFTSPTWKEVKDLSKNDMIGIPVNQNDVVPNDIEEMSKNDFWWIIGRYLGDGWTEHITTKRGDTGNNRNEKRIVICCDKRTEDERLEIEKKIKSLGWSYRISEANTTYKIYIREIEKLFDYLQTYGKGADGKRFNSHCFDLPKEKTESLLEGYLSADGWYDAKNDKYSIKTVSKELCSGVVQLVAKTYNKHCGISTQKAGKDVIEGRVVNRKEKYQIVFCKDKRSRERSIYLDNYIWTPIRSLEWKSEKKAVYNLTVKDDHSYTVNGYAVHNCGVVVSRNEFWEHNATMRTPSGELISQFDLSDTENMGLVKLDLLAVKAQTRLQEALNLLEEYGYVDSDLTLREKYDKYLASSSIDLTDADTWDNICSNKVPHLFQMTAESGVNGIEKAQPRSVIQLASVNSLIRLMKPKGAKESPLQMFVRYKNNIREWYRDMENFGLNANEIEFFEKFIGGEKYGIAETQEDLMKMVKEIDGDLVFANKVRKVIANFLASTVAI